MNELKEADKSMSSTRIEANTITTFLAGFLTQLKKDKSFKFNLPPGPIKILLLIILFFPSTVQAIDFRLGLGAGIRRINDSYLRQVYGHGFIIIPYVQVGFSQYFSAELAYEKGNKKNAPIGLYGEPSTLKVSGWEISGQLHYSFKIISPYIKLGSGYYFYRQDIDSPYVRHKVNHHHLSFQAAGGFQLFFQRNFFWQTEIKYVFLRVKPFEIKVDLGGIRYILALGFKF